MSRPRPRDRPNATTADPAQAAAILDRLTTDGLTEAAGPMSRLSNAGKAAAARILAEEQATLGEDAAQTGLESFLPLDHRAKTIITRWQLVEEADGVMVANDHTDPTYDEAVITDPSTLTDDAAIWIDPLVSDLPRLQRYQSRLATAIDHIRHGDHRYFASPTVDSFYSVWFEIHEDLIRLAGTTRADETAAGRA